MTVPVLEVVNLVKHFGPVRAVDGVTKALLSAAPIPDPRLQRSRQRIVLSGDVPSPIHPPPGCRFHTRCPVAVERCSVEIPPLRLVGGADALVACHLVDDSGDGPRLV